MKYKFSYLPFRALHNVASSCLSSLITYHFLFKVTTTLGKPITLLWTCLHFSSFRAFAHTKKRSLLSIKSWPILQVLSQRQLRRSFCWCSWPVSTTPLGPTPTSAHSLYSVYCSLQTWASFLSPTLPSQLLEDDKCALLLSQSPTAGWCLTQRRVQGLWVPRGIKGQTSSKGLCLNLLLKAMNIPLLHNNRISVETNGYNSIFLVSSVFSLVFCIDK